MRLSTLFYPASFLALSVLANDVVSSDVLTLIQSNFQDAVAPEPLMLVEFFAPWCGHCKALAPHYEEAATTLKGKNIKLAKVDCTEEAELCQAHGVQGYPTLKVFRNGTPTDYTGPRQAEGIVGYMVKQSLPPVVPITSLEAHEEIKKADRVVVVAYLPTTTEAPAAEFSATAEKHRDDYLFGLSTETDVIEHAGVNVPSIVVYRSFDEPRVEYPYPAGSAKISDIEEWVKELSIPILDEVGGENYATYANSGKPLAYLFLDPTDSKKNDWISLVKPIAAKFKSKLNFVWIDAIKFGDHAKSLNLAEVKWPAFVIQDLSTQLKYPFSQDKDIEAVPISDFVVQYLSDNLEPSLKSQPVPEKQDESVLTVVGKNFDEIVYDDNKDVFLELYATWCGHCKRLKPIWESLGDRYVGNDGITIAKMEATENDLPPSAPFRVSGFPTIKFKAAGSRDFIEYEGDRSLESLIEFVEKHAKNPTEVKIETITEEAQAPVQADSPANKHDEL